MRVSIFASIGSQNLWDELILKNQIDDLRGRCGEDTQFTVFSYDPEHPFFTSEKVVYQEYFPIDSKRPRNIFRNIKNLFSTITVIMRSNLVVIGGGWLFYDCEKQESKWPLDQWIFRTKLCQLLQKHILFYSVWIDIEHSPNLKKIRKIFSVPAEITVRDAYSKGVLSQLGIKSKIQEDPVWKDNIDKNASNGKQLGSLDVENWNSNNFEGFDFDGKKVGIALRSGYIEQEIPRIHELLDMIEKRWWKVVLMVHSFHKVDATANDLVFLAQFHTKDRKITTSIEQTYEIYKNKKIDMCIAMRFHSIILSSIYWIDYVWVSYAKKTQSVLKK